MSWCPKCHSGSATAVLVERCDQCGFRPEGGLDWIDRNPLPNKPVRSSRAMWKRANYVAPKDNKDNKENSDAITEDVIAVIRDAQHLQ